MDELEDGEQDTVTTTKGASVKRQRLDGQLQALKDEKKLLMEERKGLLSQSSFTDTGYDRSSLIDIPFLKHAPNLRHCGCCHGVGNESVAIICFVFRPSLAYERK